MKLKVGMIVTGKQGEYSYTDDRCLMLVVDKRNSSHENIRVVIIGHSDYPEEIRSKYWVNSEYFLPMSVEGFKSQYPDATILSEEDIETLATAYGVKLISEDIVEPEPYAISDEMRAELLEEIKELLLEYNYHPTDEGVNAFLDEWLKNKADLIRLFEKHPNYNGKFQIAFDYDFDRNLDMSAICSFRNYLSSDAVQSVFKKEIKLGAFEYSELNNMVRRIKEMLDVFDENSKIFTINGHNYGYYRRDYDRFMALKEKYENDENIYIANRKAFDRKLYSNLTKIDDVRSWLGSDRRISQFVNDAAEDYCNRFFSDMKIKKGQKMSRAINKILTALGVDKCPEYNKEYAKFADAVNPLKIKRHTVISIHPVDYLTMSFGNSWSSCHTIDKTNKRGMENGYEGQYSSGTMSYMLDGTSMVFYTVDAEYNGNELELQPKINRCMFHYYDNQLVQGRVYPQSNDSGANDIYKTIREVVQKVMADMLEVPNLWQKNKAGTEECDAVTLSEGTHYRDYTSYDMCNVSILKDERTHHEYVEIGHNPICPHCGREHRRQNCIECNNCY